MSLPISQATLILGAALAAKDVVSRVAEKVVDAVGFDDVLRNGAVPPEASESKTTLLTKTVSAIRDRLGEAGIDVSSPIGLTLTSDGLQVSGDHDQAAQIEALLASDGNVNRLASRLYAAAGAVQLSVGASDRALGPANLPAANLAAANPLRLDGGGWSRQDN